MNEFAPKQFGKYFLMEKLATGGMAEIYKAKTFGAEGFEKLLAIKRILPHCAADKEFITMLVDEAKLSVLLSHANIVQVYDLGKVGEDYFIAMEFIHGVNLRDVLYRCRERGVTPPADLAVYITSEACKGLDYAHRKTDANGQPLGIVHRDISPQNILISYEGEVKIVDFGIAKAAMNISHTMAGILKGKIAYMSPEQAMGKPIDRRTDIFSTGIILSEMLTAEKLFTGESQFEVLKKIRTTRIDAGSLPESIPHLLRPILAKALAYHADDRFQNAGDFQVELTKFLYAIYLDFSPRKLAGFITDLFKEEIRQESMRNAELLSIEQQTSSMSLKEEGRQVDLVIRNDASEKTGTTKKTRSASTRKRPIKRSWPLGLIGGAAAGLILIAGGAVGAFTVFPKLRFWDKGEPRTLAPISSTPAPLAQPEKPAPPKVQYPAETGTLNLISDPSGATVLLNGRTTGLVTPATLEKLWLNTDLKINLSKPDYEDFEQTIRLTTATPQKISTKLIALLPQRGTISVTSIPLGASVLIDGQMTGKTTPAKIANLELQRPHKLEVAMKGFEPWDEEITLRDTALKPFDITLKRLETASSEEKTAPTTLPSSASLTITSTPSGADVFLGKARRGTTPLTLDDLKLGQPYAFRLEKEGYKTITRKKTLARAKENLVASLEKVREPPPVADASPPASPPSAEPVNIAAGGEPGKIKIASNPTGADVFINAEYRGTTPLTVSVPSGTAKVIVTKEGKAKHATTVTVKPGETVNLSDVALRNLYGEISIVTTPPRASVTLDGQPIPAKTPVTIRKVRSDQQHTVTVELDGFKTWNKAFTMETNDKSFNILLEKQ